jgi:hypothetical protein
MERLNTDDRNLVESEIKLAEEAHGAIVRRHFGIDWREPEHYDLVLNTERLPVGRCVEAICALLEEPAFQETPESRRVLADLALQTHIRAALRADPRTSKMNIGVEATDGNVKLTGILEGGLEESDAIEVAQGVPGVVRAESALRSASLPRYKLDS